MKNSAGGQQGWRDWLGFALLNFATPIVFFLVFRAAGAKPAISFAIVSTFLQVFAHWIYRQPFSPFFMVSSGFTVFFGSMDLVATSPRFFRLVPGVENFIIGSIFLGTVFTRRPIVAWFAASLPDRWRPNLGETALEYLKKVTAVWSLYFFLKGAVFLYVAFRVDLGQLIVFRAIFGSISFLLMFAGEYAYRKWFRA